MSIDAITAKIVSDATEYANGLTSEAKAEAESIMAAARQEADSVLAGLEAQGSKDAVVVMHRKKSAAELEARKMRLAVKQQAVTEAMEAAINHIAGMDSGEYLAFLLRKIAETGIREGEVLLNAKDKDSLGVELIKAANEELKDGKLTLSSQTINAKGGFVLKYGAREINSTLETMVGSVKEAVTSDVVAALFQE